MLNVAIEASTWVNRRGYGRFTRELTRALLRAGSGHRFTLVVDSGAAAADDLPDAPRVVVDTGEAVVHAAASDASRSPRDLWGMSRALSATAFDVVLFPTLYSYVPVLSRGHVTVVVHDAMPETMPGHGARNRQGARALAHQDVARLPACGHHRDRVPCLR